MEKNNSALFYTCSLIEYIGRETKNKRSEVIDYLGKETLTRIFHYADVFHCEPIAKTADDFIQRAGISEGTFDPVRLCRYTVPDYWDIGEVFARLIEDSYEEGAVVEGLTEVYHSWIADAILNFNSDFFYQSREYIAVCYKEGKVLES
ncbi:MAG: hypothetical protein HFE83_13065 [Lachnospiraceae bacterium]|nr:hypothetical protein [Lachnospiraceae bacterium]